MTDDPTKKVRTKRQLASVFAPPGGGAGVSLDVTGAAKAVGSGVSWLGSGIASAAVWAAGGIADVSGDIAEGIGNAFTSLAKRFGFIEKGGHGLYPENSDHVTKIDKKNWSQIPFPYSFEILGSNGKPVEEFKKFELPIPPSSLEQTEEFAVNIRPTQGGTVVTHSGNRYKTLVLKGTTGMTPNSNGYQVDPKTGESFTGFGDPNNIKYKSGFEVFMLLKNWFKAYQDYKTVAKNMSSKMVFRNYKDGESLIVEPPKFKMIEQAARPLLYDYEIIFRVIGVLKPEPKKPPSFFDHVNNVLGGIDNVTRGINNVVTLYNDTLTQVDAFYTTNLVGRYYKCVNAYNVLTGIDKPFLDVRKLRVAKDLGVTALIDQLIGKKEDDIKKIEEEIKDEEDKEPPIKEEVPVDVGQKIYEDAINDAKTARETAENEYNLALIKLTFDIQIDIVVRYCTYYFAKYTEGIPSKIAEDIETKRDSVENGIKTTLILIS